MVPSLRWQSLGKDVCHLLFGIDVLQRDAGILKLLIGAGEVNLVGARNVAQFSAAALANNPDSRLVVFEDFKMDIAAEDVAPQLQGNASEKRL